MIEDADSQRDKATIEWRKSVEDRLSDFKRDLDYLKKDNAELLAIVRRLDREQHDLSIRANARADLLEEQAREREKKSERTKATIGQLSFALSVFIALIGAVYGLWELFKAAVAMLSSNA